MTHQSHGHTLHPKVTIFRTGPLYLWIALCSMTSSLALGQSDPEALSDEVLNTNENFEDNGTSNNGAPAKVKIAKAPKDSSEQSIEQAEEGEEMRIASSSHVRRFHEVLDEILAEFGYDIKIGQIKGLSNLAIRKVRVSQAIPRTYEDYMETLLVERIRENSQVKLISCVPCKTRTSSLVEGKLMITSPATNLAKLESAATLLGINYFMDAVLVYHTSHMVLAIDVFQAQTKELVWARTYNSETIKSRYQKLAIDYSQVAKSRPGEDYVPEYRSMFGVGGAILPNVSGQSEDSTMINMQVRGTEKFNNRHNEFGMLLSIYKTAQSSRAAYPTEGVAAGTTPEETTTALKPKPFEQAFGIYGLYSQLLIGSVESYNEIRHGFNGGLGGLFATGYLAPVFRGGWDIYLGRRFVSSFGLDFVGPSSVLINNKTVSTPGGAGGHVLLSLTY